MSITLQSVEIINNLKASAEAITGESYTDLTEAVQALKYGYGTGGGSSEEFYGVKYLEFKDSDGGNTNKTLPTIADARSLDGHNMRPDRMVYGLFWNQTANLDGGMNVYLKEIYMPSEPTRWENTFSRCFRLEKIYGNCENVTNLYATFDGCKALAEIPYMPSITYVGESTFRNCISLTSINFYTKVNTFNANAFTGCTNLTDIYVPWAEDEVANAPWGATNATIHYNTTYDENHNPIVEE